MTDLMQQAHDLESALRDAFLSLSSSHHRIREAMAATPATATNTIRLTVVMREEMPRIEKQIKDLISAFAKVNLTFMSDERRGGVGVVLDRIFKSLDDNGYPR